MCPSAGTMRSPWDASMRAEARWRITRAGGRPHATKWIVRLAAWMVAVLLVPVGCGAAPEQRHPEAKVRKQSPVPVCTQQLSPVKGSGGKAVVRNLDPEQWLHVLVPAFTPERGLNDKDLDCTGNYAFANESLRGGVSPKGWPRPFDPDDVEMRAGPEGMRTVWLR